MCNHWYNAGFERGYSIATWIDVPEIGQPIDKCVDWIGLGDTVTSDNQVDYMQVLCSEAESMNRQYSPFEHTAKEINDLEEFDSEEAWEAFDEGIMDGISKRIEEARQAGMFDHNTDNEVDLVPTSDKVLF